MRPCDHKTVKSPLLLLIAAVVLSLLVFVSDPGRAAGLGPGAQEAAASAPAAGQSAPASSDDAAAGQLVLERCGGCHSLDTLRNHPQDEAGWTQTVAQMERMGAAVSPAEEPVIVEYLARHFGKH